MNGNIGQEAKAPRAWNRYMRGSSESEGAGGLEEKVRREKLRTWGRSEQKSAAASKAKDRRQEHPELRPERIGSLPSSAFRLQKA